MLYCFLSHYIPKFHSLTLCISPLLSLLLSSIFILILSLSLMLSLYLDLSCNLGALLFRVGTPVIKLFFLTSYCMEVIAGQEKKKLK